LSAGFFYGSLERLTMTGHGGRDAILFCTVSGRAAKTGYQAFNDRGL